MRGDHNHFTDNTVGDHTIQVDGIRGVFDHNYLQTPNGENINFFQITNYGTDGMADAIWTVPDNFGSSDYVFIENNYFVGSFVYDCDFGGKIVLRYNIAWYGTQIQTHGVGSGAQVRGCRSVETYGDTFTYSANPSATNFAFLVDYESGTGMWWNITTARDSWRSYVKMKSALIPTPMEPRLRPLMAGGCAGPDLPEQEARGIPVRQEPATRVSTR